MNNDDDGSYPKAPDLQEWVERYGGYPNIPWAEWDTAVAAWHLARRVHTAGTVNNDVDLPHKRKRRTV